jgi:hypothetical protein
MTKLTSHKINPVNDQIQIAVVDDKGAGGAHHQYSLTFPGGRETFIGFQNGPIAEAGINGLTQEALLAIVEHRLECFQAGPYACRENAVALTHVQTAMLWLHKRTLDRMQRGVEGTHQK